MGRLLLEERVFSTNMVDKLDSRSKCTQSESIHPPEKKGTNTRLVPRMTRRTSLLIGQEVFKDVLSKMLNVLYSYIRGGGDLCVSVARMELDVGQDEREIECVVYS